MIPETTEEIIRRSSFRRTGTYVYALARDVRHPEKHLMVSREPGEITVVTREEHLGDVDVIRINEDRWTHFAVDCANPFYCVGFIAKIAAFLTAAGIDILVISTFSRDWFLVKEQDADRAAGVLRDAGLSEH